MYRQPLAPIPGARYYNENYAVISQQEAYTRCLAARLGPPPRFDLSRASGKDKENDGLKKGVEPWQPMGQLYFTLGGASAQRGGDPFSEDDHVSAAQECRLAQQSPGVTRYSGMLLANAPMHYSSAGGDPASRDTAGSETSGTVNESIGFAPIPIFVDEDASTSNANHLGGNVQSEQPGNYVQLYLAMGRSPDPTRSDIRHLLDSLLSGPSPFENLSGCYKSARSGSNMNGQKMDDDPSKVHILPQNKFQRVSKKTMEKFLATLYDDQVAVVFGGSFRAVKVNKHELCYRSEFFANAFNGNSKEAQSRCIRLCNDPPFAIMALLEFVVTSGYKLPRETTSHLTTLEVHIHIYVVAVKYDVPSLADEAVTRYVFTAADVLAGQGPSQDGLQQFLESVALLFQKTAGSADPFRKTVVKMVALALDRLVRVPAFGEMLLGVEGFGVELEEVLEEGGLVAWGRRAAPGKALLRFKC